MSHYEVSLLLVIIVIAFTVLRYITKNGIFNLFSGVLCLVLAFNFTHTHVILPLVVTLSLLGFYLIYDGVWGRL